MTALRVRLYTYAMSPYAAKVHCCLLYKQIDFECFYLNPLRARKDLPIGRQVPVLSIGEEHRADSTPICLWLDERFPDAPRLLPADPVEREALMRVDDWISKCLIPGSFRSYPGSGINRILNGWKLSRVMTKTAQGGLPLPLRVAWPLVVTRVPFVRRLLAQADDGRSIRDAKLKLYDDFVAHLEGGPFIAGRTSPSLPDFAAYPQFALFYQVGFRGANDILEAPAIMSWLGRMQSFVRGEPPMLPAHVCRQTMPDTPH